MGFDAIVPAPKRLVSITQNDPINCFDYCLEFSILGLQERCIY